MKKKFYQIKARKLFKDTRQLTGLSQENFGKYLGLKNPQVRVSQIENKSCEVAGWLVLNLQDVEKDFSKKS